VILRQFRVLLVGDKHVERLLPCLRLGNDQLETAKQARRNALFRFPCILDSLKTSTKYLCGPMRSYSFSVRVGKPDYQATIVSETMRGAWGFARALSASGECEMPADEGDEKFGVAHDRVRV
jgi:hypothetical protein